MNAALRNAVRQRAKFQCEYCQLPERFASAVLFQIEHIIARQHRGQATADNLALACHRCNLHKGPNLTGIDHTTGKVVRLFNPRRMTWARHFRWSGPILVGRTAVGRATVDVLNVNEPERVNLRQALLDEGVFPPS